MTEFAVTIICPPQVEEKLLDRLLTLEGADAFTTSPTHSHGLLHGQLSAIEQVMGRGRAVRVQVLVTQAQLQVLREVLKAEFSGVGIQFWGTPLAFREELA